MVRKGNRGYDNRGYDNRAYDMHTKIFGSPLPTQAPDLWLAKYSSHLSDVRAYFTDADRMIELCWEEGDGWPERVPSSASRYPMSRSALEPSRVPPRAVVNDVRGRCAKRGS